MKSLKLKNILLTLPLISATLFAGTSAHADELRLLSWSNYAPDDVIKLFKAETGIDVKVTTSNNEDMISKLRATGGSGFDLAQPSQDRVTSAQENYDIYKPMDLSKIEAASFITSMLDATKTNTTLKDNVYSVPHIWGTSGLVLNTKAAGSVKDYTDLCSSDLSGKVSYRLKRPTLIGFAFAMGMDPFAAYADKDKYSEMMAKVEAKMVECKPVVKTYWTGGDALLNLMRSGEVTAAMAWDTGGWKLNSENKDINFVAPTSGALGWIDTFTIPRKGKNDEAAYKWINFVMKPEIAAKITASATNFTASKGADEFADDALKAQYQSSFTPAALDNIKWYPPVPTGLEEIEGKVLDRVKAAK